MGKPYVVYGQKGTGSVPVEAALLLLGAPHEGVDRQTDEVMARVSPLLQVPALVLPNEEVMTKSAAIPTTQIGSPQRKRTRR
jgi:GST-like protein